ncbi:restriction endonuclease subunit S [Aliarcobacter cryaerophilus]|uniref:restriction endonuclease subunit S n=1 Tax=Aliarcobacter cryaerophilus TaxID=28198 RepID=UPI0021B5B8EF|nr:restriction endonuclease subunit S [Aliarcobacter cryaerophilus]MCT7533913.1 restriction endonuclease subunit S [Aliarcobacter cryaerophilus]
MAELYSLPDGWEWKKLGKIAKLQNGFAFKSKLFVNDGLPIVRIKNIKNEKVLLDDVVYFNVEYYGKKLDSYQIKKNDILIAMSGATTGKIGLYDTEEISYLNQRVGLFRIENSNLRSYLFYFLSTQIEKNLELSLGAAQPNLSTEQINNIELPFPPFEEQKRIVAKLDILFAKIDKAIALHQKNIDEADIFMASVLNDVFVELNGVYQKRQLDSFDKKMSSGGTPSRKEKLYWDNGTIDWFSSGELNQLYTLPSKEKITQLGLEKTSTKLFSKGTLLIGMYDTAAMKMSILSNDGSCNQAIVGFKSDESELNILFLKYQLEYLKKDILEQRQGVRQQNLNLSKIKNIEIEYPPLKTQQKVVSYLDEISQKMEKIKQIQKEKMQSLKELKASILDKAFKGEL